MSIETGSPATAGKPSRTPRRKKRVTSLFSHGESMIWLTGGSLLICVAMIVGLLWIVASRGATTFWPRDVVEIETLDGRAFMGPVSEEERYRPTEDEVLALPEAARPQARTALAGAADAGSARRRQLRTANFELTGTHYTWVSDFEIASESKPEWAALLERQSDGWLFGTPKAFRIDGDVVATGPEAAWAKLEEHHEAVRDRFDEIRSIEKRDLGRTSRRLEQARLAVRQAEIDELRGDVGAEAVAAARAAEQRTADEVARENERLGARILALRQENARYALVMETANGREVDVPVAGIVRAFTPNRLGFWGRLSVFASRWWEFLTAEPREANSSGGVWPAIFGTVVMTLLMSLLVVPFGVLAALYMREYAKQGPLVSTVRIAINNLAGVPSIVFGVFGLGFFCYFVGVSIDQLFFEARLPDPTYGKGGVLWASLTLALLTLPVVIVATEEALAAVPGSMREGSYACGASKWQTIRRIVLPRALPGIMTGLILAVARGAGEVAPLMLVGAVKWVPDLPMDGVFPFVHPDRKFMHLGFHIYDLGFQSQNSEASKPLVFSTTLLLISIVVLLNALGMWVRARLRRRFQVGR